MTSLSAVAFDLDGNDTLETLRGNHARRIHLNLKFQDQINMGRTIAESTLRWWFKPDLAQARSYLVDDPIPTHEALAGFDSFIFRHGIQYSWGNGSDFDNALMSSLYQTFDRDSPIIYKNRRCTRTFYFLEKNPFKVDGIVEHYGIDDCYYQILRLQHVYRNFIVPGSPNA